MGSGGTRTHGVTASVPVRSSCLIPRSEFVETCADFLAGLERMPAQEVIKTDELRYRVTQSIESFLQLLAGLLPCIEFAPPRLRIDKRLIDLGRRIDQFLLAFENGYKLVESLRRPSQPPAYKLSSLRITLCLSVKAFGEQFLESC